MDYINKNIMKGHNWGLCRKCGKTHIHINGMLGKKHSKETLKKFKGRIAWNKGLTKETDERVAKYGKKGSESWTQDYRKEHKKKAGDRLRKARNKYIKEHPEHQSYAGRLGGLKSIGGLRKRLMRAGFISKQQQKLYDIVKLVYPSAVMEYPVSYGGRGQTKFLDVAVPEFMLDFEYDGLYWHADKEQDKERDNILSEKGWIIIRITKDLLEKIEEGGLSFVLP